MLIFTDEILNPRTSEGLKFCKMPLGGGGEERNEKDCRRDTWEILDPPNNFEWKSGIVK